MTSRDFCYWLQGCFELNDNSTLDTKQVELIKKHLNLVFAHEIDPSMGDEVHQGKLNEIHHGKTNQSEQESLTQQPSSIVNVPDYMNPNLSEEELDAKYGKNTRPRC